jgi:Transglycosylase SLT domain
VTRGATAIYLAGLVGLLFAASATAREVRLPLSVEPPLIREALMRELFHDARQRAVFWGEPGGCSFFYLEDPKVEGEVDRLRVTAHGEARLGTEIGNTCLSPIAWSGFLELFEQPRLDGWQLRFVVVDSNLYDEKHEKTLLGGQLWDRIKESVQPRFGAVTVDLGGPFRELRAFLPLVLGAAETNEARAALDSLHPVSARALPKGIVVEAAIELSEAPPAPTPAAPQPPLTDAEIEAFTARANQWDAFVTFVIKTLGAKTLSTSAHHALLETLLGARYEILAALSAPSRREDPVRGLFLKSWERLRPVADDISRGLPGAEAAQVLTFVAAGDALRALDQMGPTFGIEISADGLRRMARMIAPGAAEDPLQYEPAMDPALRLFLGFGEPITGEVPTPGPSPSSRWSPRRWLGEGDAWAAVLDDHSRNWKGWVAEQASDLSDYLKRVRRLLASVADAVIGREKPSAADADLFRRLLPATAWQESCWRQFRVESGVVTYLRSSRASVGMLQLNERVWRGFYEVEKLRWSVGYNAEAGSEVLLHYLGMVDDERPPGARPPTAVERARAAYAAYNGGPEQLRRYLDPKRRGRALTRVVDRLFGAKFDAAGEGMEARVAGCFGGGAA